MSDERDVEAPGGQLNRKKRRVLLLSSYDAASHRRWHRGLSNALPDIEMTVKSLPARHFLWRTRGNPLWWATTHRALLEEDWDLLVVTSATDLSTLRGLVPSLTRVPTVAYFHENQLAYPDRRRDGVDVNLALLDLYTAMAADRVVFNSAWNRESLLSGLDTLLRRLPDHAPRGSLDEIRGKSQVLPVPLEDSCFAGSTERSGPLQIVWNHRWEYDKAPERFFSALSGVDCTVHVLGQRFRRWPACFDAFRDDPRVATWGFVESADTYRAVLRGSDVVVSTALHEFQGLAVLEAVGLGCHPLVPDRLSYREIYPSSCRYPSLPNDPVSEAIALGERLQALAADRTALRERVPPDVREWSWQRLAGPWRDLLERRWT